MPLKCIQSVFISIYLIQYKLFIINNWKLLTASQIGHQHPKVFTNTFGLKFVTNIDI